MNKPEERTGLRKVVELYKDKVFSIALRMTGNREAAEDIVQESFLSVLQSIDSFRGESKISTWLFRITLNKCKDYFRSVNRREVDFDADCHSFGWRGAPLDAEADVLRKEMQADLEAAILKLPPKYREVFILRQVEGLSYKEISSILKISVVNLKVRVYRAREMLQEYLKDKWSPEDESWED